MNSRLGITSRKTATRVYWHLHTTKQSNQRWWCQIWGHTISHAGLVGGGTVPRPGEVTLAHRGVLFLDESNEFAQHTLEVLRQPVEDKIVTISRARGSLTFPANFLLVLAQNPCA